MPEHELVLTARAHIRLLEIVNNWPLRTRGGMKQIGDLGNLLDLTTEETARIGWTPVLDQEGRVQQYRFNGAALVERVLDERQQAALRQMVNADPLPDQVPAWTRQSTDLAEELGDALVGHVITEGTDDD